MSEPKKAANHKPAKGGGGGGGGSSEDASLDADALLASLSADAEPKAPPKPKAKKRAPAKAKVAAVVSDDDIDRASAEPDAEAKADVSAAASVALARTAAAAKEQKMKEVDPIDVQRSVALIAMLESIFNECKEWPAATVAKDVVIRVFQRPYAVVLCNHRREPCVTLDAVLRMFAKSSTSRLHYLHLVSSFDGANGPLVFPAELKKVGVENVGAAGTDNVRLTELQSQLEASLNAPSASEFMKKALVPLSSLFLFANFTAASKHTNGRGLIIFPEEFHLPLELDKKGEAVKTTLRRKEGVDLCQQLCWVMEAFRFAQYAQLTRAVQTAKLDDEESASTSGLDKAMLGRYVAWNSLAMVELAVAHVRSRESGAEQKRHKDEKKRDDIRAAKAKAQEKAKEEAQFAKNNAESDAAAEADINGTSDPVEDAFDEDAKKVIAGKPLDDPADKLKSVILARAQSAKKKRKLIDLDSSDAKAKAEPAKAKNKRPRTVTDLTDDTDEDKDGDVEMAAAPAPAAPAVDPSIAKAAKGEVVGASPMDTEGGLEAC